jgi:hypothetical protein
MQAAADIFEFNLTGGCGGGSHVAQRQQMPANLICGA